MGREDTYFGGVVGSGQSGGLALPYTGLDVMRENVCGRRDIPFVYVCVYT